MLHDNHKIWLTGRGIEPALAEKFGIKTTRDASGYWLTVPYLEDGKEINHKYRMASEKRHRMDPDSPLTLWNVDCLKDCGDSPVIITEGEWDALIALQAGFRHVVSIPNGAPKDRTDKPEDAKRYSWVWRHLSLLEKVKTFILAVDSDGPGMALAADLAALLGPDRCKFVTYPDFCKDLNDALLYDPMSIVDIITYAKPYPIKGLYRVSDFPERGEVTAWDTGIEPLRNKLFVVPGTLTVLTGYANMGKSSLVNEMIGHFVGLNVPVCVASFETDVKPILVNGIKQSMMQCNRHEMGQRKTDEFDAMIEDNLVIISQQIDEDQEMTLEDFLELCRTAVVRDGAKIIILDPWNELEHKRKSGETETEYISRALRAIKRFAKQNDVAFWIVAHPSKPGQGVNSPPGLYDISGSAHWANKADYGITYHRKDPKKNEALIMINKIRMGLPGEKSQTAVMLDYRDWRFKELDGPQYD